MDEMKALNVPLGVWWRAGVLASIGWAISAAINGRNALALVAVPLLVWLWVYAILAVDRWVRKGAERD
jgi:hypothetical protein